MLILTRKVNQAIMVGDDITVVITQIKGSQVRIGILAPDHLEINREEIYAKKLKERVSAEAKED